MSTTPNHANDLRTALKARLPGIHLRTLEEFRALNALRFVVGRMNSEAEKASEESGAASAPKKLERWSAASGHWTLDTRDTENNIQDSEIAATCAFDEVLNAFKQSNDNVVLALLDPWDELARPIYQRCLREALDHARGSGKCIVLVGKDWKITPELQADIFVCDIPLPTRAEIEEYIQSLVALYGSNKALKAKLTIDEKCIPELARACTGLTLNEAKGIVSLSLIRFRGIGQDAIRMAIKEKKQIVQRSGILEYREAGNGMSEVGGLSNLKSWIKSRTIQFSNKAKERGIKAPRGVLLVGVPGSGKSLSSDAIAATWNIPLLILDAGKLFGSLVGQSEANLREVQAVAEAVAPCVLRIDEVDKGLSQNGGNDGGTSARVFGSLLTWMQECTKEVFIVATGNDAGKIDPALMRRFNAVFAVDLPDTAARAEILSIHLKRAGHTFKTEAVSTLANLTKGFTGSELENLVQSALLDALNDNDRKPNAQDVTNAIKAAVPISKTMEKEINALREFCKSGRAIPAGGSIEADAAKQVKANAAGVDL